MRRISLQFVQPALMVFCLSRRAASGTVGMSGFTHAPFNNNADGYLEVLQQEVEELNSDLSEDVNLSDGVLEIDTKSGKFVINKQAPKMQLWLSSPFSGPRHYDMVAKEGSEDVVWKCDKDGHNLSDRLATELTKALGKAFKLP